ncbi:MAG: hypothetical protein WCH01_02600 [Methylococcaceae bacterium]
MLIAFFDCDFYSRGLRYQGYFGNVSTAPFVALYLYGVKIRQLAKTPDRIESNPVNISTFCARTYLKKSKWLAGNKQIADTNFMHGKNLEFYLDVKLKLNAGLIITK